MFKRYRDFKNINIVISGAASGIGKAIANEFLNWGDCQLILLDINLNGLVEVKEDAKKKLFSGNIEIFQVDIASPSSVSSFVSNLKNKKIDILINSAGVVNVGAFENISMLEIEKVILVNLVGTIRLTHVLLPLILKSNTPSIININSVGGYVAAPGLSAYSASKFGLRGFSDAIRAEMGRKVQICNIAPAFVKTNLALNAVSNDTIDKCDQGGSKEKANSFLHQIGAKPETVAKSVISALQYNFSWKLVGIQAYMLYYLNKISPFIRGRVVDYAYKILKKEGIISIKK